MMHTQLKFVFETINARYFSTELIFHNAVLDQQFVCTTICYKSGWEGEYLFKGTHSASVLNETRLLNAYVNLTHYPENSLASFYV